MEFGHDKSDWLLSLPEGETPGTAEKEPFRCPQKRSPNPKTRRATVTLPELEQSKTAVLNTLASQHSRRGYEHAMDWFIAWYCSEPRLTFNRSVVVRYRSFLERLSLSAATINLHLSAIRRLADESSKSGWLSPELAIGAILGLLLGCGLRRSEVVGLNLDQLQSREGHWVIVNLVGKGGRLRTVPVPSWCKALVDDWLRHSGVSDGRVFRRVLKGGVLDGAGVTVNVVWYAVKRCAGQASISNLAPHDLRRTCARLCHGCGGELEQIQFLLGHASVQTTERCIGSKQKLQDAVNDRLGISVANDTP